MIPIPLERIQSGYLSMPAGKSRSPGVLVIHELFGLTDDMKRIADRFAASGYAALAIDLGGSLSVLTCMLRLWSEVIRRDTRDAVVRELLRALAWFGTQTGVDGQRVGVAGFCMGGRYALEIACLDDPNGPRAAAVFYGTNPDDLGKVARACPIVGNYPALDPTASMSQRLEDALRDARRDRDEIHVYPWAFHSFMNESFPWPIHRRDLADRAWRRTVEFFETHLRGSA